MVRAEKRRRALVKWAVVALVLGAALIWVVRFIAALEPDALKVELITYGSVSGASNQLFRLTNHHKRLIHFSYLPETQGANGWPIEDALRVNGSRSPFAMPNIELKPGQSTVVSVARPNAGPWRLLVCYTKETFRRDEITFEVRRKLSLWGWDSFAERIRSEKHLVHIICGPELSQ